MAVKIACHQPNFCPWFPFFYKMAMVDIFVILENVQFEKNGFQNRYKAGNGKWVTIPVSHGKELIHHKNYADGRHLATLNKMWISVLKETLGIKTVVIEDMNFGLKSTDHLIRNIQMYNGNVYVTNPDAKIKYLDEDKMIASGIDIEYCNVPKEYQKHTFDILAEYGIEGARKILSNARSTKREVIEPALSVS